MKLAPLLVIAPNRVWRTYSGGATLDVINHESQSADGHFPEDWLLSATRAVNAGREAVNEGVSNVIFNGETMLFTDLVAQFPAGLLGETHLAKYGPDPKFLLKFLDAAIRLHLQCHPTREFARQFLNADAGKTEGYVILGSRTPDPYIYLGFGQSVEPAYFRQLVTEQNIDAILPLLQKIPVNPGDVFLVPGGMPHAIGEGVLLIEIMEPTDFAVRIEFARGGYVLPEAARFMGKDVDFALSMFDFTARTIAEIKERCFVRPRVISELGGNVRSVLFDAKYTPCFRMERWQIRDRLTVANDTMQILIAVAGSGVITAGGQRQAFQPYDRFLIPAETREITVETTQGARLISAMPPI